MRIERPLSFRRILALSAVLVAAPFLPGIVGSSANADGTTAAGDIVGPDGMAVMERQISSDMVVDWLDAPPADAAEWLAGPELSADHRDPVAGHHDGHDHEHVEEAAAPEAPATAEEAVLHTEAANGSAPSASPGQGFAVFSKTARWLSGGYTIRLVGNDTRIEQYRDELQAAAQGASAATGIPVRVAAGRGGSVNPGRGEITVVLAAGPCGSTALGCGGPALTSSEIVSGRVWISPSALEMAHGHRLNLASHELSHALGLQHFGSNWSDGRQVMYPTIVGTSAYRLGDHAGLKFVAGRYDRPAGTVTSRSYAAGHVRVLGTLSSGSRVRISIGSTSTEVSASGGKFSAAVPAGAGHHRVCGVVLDAAAGFRGDLGCAKVGAPGAPFGALETVANSFETVRVSGWAIDPQTAGAVEVQIRRNGTLVKTVAADGARPDVAHKHHYYGEQHGFNVEIPAVAGANDVCVRILGVGRGGNKDLGCRTVSHAVDPVGALESVQSTDLGAMVSGWALDPNTASAVNLIVTVNGTVPAAPGMFAASANRPDVARNHPAHGPNHGFSQRLALVPGDHEICVTVKNVGLGQDRSLGCSRVRVAGPGVAKAVDSVGSALPGDVTGVVDDVVSGTAGAVGNTVHAANGVLGG